jgi:acyl-coenzyme A thioesterase PaaI-like protein
MAETPAVTASEAEEILANQPFSKLIGVEVGEVGYGHATLRIPLREDLLQQFGTVHGGGGTKPPAHSPALPPRPHRRPR